MAERLMRTIKACIRTKLIERMDLKQASWDADLDMIGRDYNASLLENTGTTPFELARGRTVIPAQLNWLPSLKKSEQSTRLWKTVIIRNRQMQQANRERVNVKRKEKEFPLGSLVKRRSFQQMVGRSRSLLPKFDGPFIVKDKIADNMYRITLEGRGWTQDLHADQLEKFEPQDSKTKILPANSSRLCEIWGGRSVV